MLDKRKIWIEEAAASQEFWNKTIIMDILVKGFQYTVHILISIQSTILMYMYYKRDLRIMTYTCIYKALEKCKYVAIVTAWRQNYSDVCINEE